MASLRARLLTRPALVALVALVAVVLVAALATAKLTSSASGDLTAADKSFVKVCRDHGGTPALAPGSGDYVKDARDCTIEYGGESYEMYAVHPEGFSAREAADARRSCRLQAAQERRDPEDGPGSTPHTFTWHPRSGICEKSRA
jgi:hypothetical protein